MATKKTSPEPGYSMPSQNRVTFWSRIHGKVVMDILKYIWLDMKTLDQIEFNLEWIRFKNWRKSTQDGRYLQNEASFRDGTYRQNFLFDKKEKAYDHWK